MPSNPYIDPEEDDDLLGVSPSSSSPIGVTHSQLMSRVVEHMASESNTPSVEAQLMATVMQLLKHDTQQHRLPTILAALVDKTDNLSYNLDERWEFREAEMRVQYCWMDLFALSTE